MTSKSYNNFIGIDIGKFNLVVSLHTQKDTKEYENNPAGIHEFLADYADILKKSLCVLETTGGYELELLYTLCNKNISVHRANTRKVKSFIRSYGTSAKTDNLDAQALAKYGFERKDNLDLFVPQSKKSLALFALMQRRLDLKQMLVAEKNRSKSPGSMIVKTSCHGMIDVLNGEVKKIQEEIDRLIDSDPVLKQKKEILKTVPGIGNIISSELLILLPELGRLSRKEVASLCGVAPMSSDSGSRRGYRRTGNGRSGVKPILFVAAMAARNSKTHLKAFYEKLVAKGKKKMVALIALMRKIIVIANAKIKELIEEEKMLQSSI